MLDSLFVRNFRIFKKLGVKPLSRVNLIVGKNNSGKSCFLEAIRIYINNASPSILGELISQRNEFWEQEIQDSEKNARDYEHPLRYLFYGYHLPAPSFNDGIQIGVLKENDKASLLNIRTQFYRTVSSQDGRRFEIVNLPLNYQKELFDLESDSDSGIALEIEKGDLKILFPVSGLRNKFFQQRVRRNISLYEYESNKNVQIVPAGSMNEEKISLLWDNINLTDLLDEVVEGLKLINNKIKGIALVGGQQSISKHRIPIVRLEQSPERFPLKSMGDGMTRLFHLIIALVNAKDGTLLVDEFENGLHWLVLPKVWDTVFKLAERLNVQVFATTHSRDCIQGFKQAWEQNESLGSFHRLDPDPENGAKSVSYSLETLSDALDMDVEVR